MGSWFAVVFVVAINSPGCIARHDDFVRTGRVRVQKTESGVLSLPAPAVFRDGNETVIAGAVYRAKFSGGTQTGHVCVSLVGSDGQILREFWAAISPPWVSTYTPFRSLYLLKFEGVPPQGAIVRVRFVHEPPPTDDQPWGTIETAGSSKPTIRASGT